jgi:cytochrome c oxidase subunit III
VTREAAVIDVSHLPNLVSGSRGTLWWSFVLLLVIEATVFATLISAYFYLRMGAPAWPPPGISPPDLALPTINTFILILSSVPMYLADKGITQGKVNRLLWGGIGAIVLATIFLILKVVEYSGVYYRWDDHAYGSIVWLIIGFHSAHVASVVLKTIVMMILGWRGYFNERRHLGVQVNGLYWHFVVMVWLPLYVVLYWSPRLM